MRSNTNLANEAIRLDVLVAVVLILVLVGVLLVKLAEVERASERTVVDMEVATLRTELQLAIASHVVRGEDAQLAGWAGRNPAELVWSEAHDAPAAGGLTLSGQWHWDAGAGALVYIYRQGGRLQLRLARARPGFADGWVLGGGLLLVPEKNEKGR